MYTSYLLPLKPITHCVQKYQVAPDITRALSVKGFPELYRYFAVGTFEDASDQHVNLCGTL